MQGNCITLQRSVSSRGLLVAQNTVVPCRSLNEFGRSYPLMVDHGVILIWEKLFLEVKQQSFLSHNYGNSVYVTHRPKPGEKRSRTTTSVNHPRILFLPKSPGLDRNQWNEWPTLPLGSGVTSYLYTPGGTVPPFPWKWHHLNWWFLTERPKCQEYLVGRHSPNSVLLLSSQSKDPKRGSCLWIKLRSFNWVVSSILILCLVLCLVPFPSTLLPMHIEM